MDGSDGACASTLRLSPSKCPATDPSGVELRRSPRRSPSAGSASAPPQRRGETPDSEDDGVSTPASQKSCLRELDSELADVSTPPDVKNMGGTDKMPNQKNIIQIRGYNLAVCAFVMNIGKTTKKSHRGDRLRDKYKVPARQRRDHEAQWGRADACGARFHGACQVRVCGSKGERKARVLVL